MRARACWVLLAAAVPGLLFAPIFGLAHLVPPIAAVLAACYAVVELGIRVPALQPWRPALALVLGCLALTEVSLFGTTRGGLPTPDSGRALVAGVTDSWRLALQSTWPVRPDAALLLFVPLLVLFAGMLGIELLRRPALAVLPSLLLLVLSQAFVAVSGILAGLAALGYAVAVAGLFVTRARAAILVTIALGLLAGTAATAIGTGPAFSLQRDVVTGPPLPRTVSPLSEIAARLSTPDTPVFGYTSDTPVDRWRLVVLDEFNGVLWTPTDRYRRLGTEIGPPAGVTVPTVTRAAHVTVPGDLPWLPSQAMPASVRGIEPSIDQPTGTLLLPGRAGPVAYDLRWWEPNAGLDTIADAAVDSGVSAHGLGSVPPRIADLARVATGGARPTFRTALLLEQFLSRNYRVATGNQLPTGSGWPQLNEFLLETKRGTSEQFAASYVALARIVGIPARLAVGYRAPRQPAGGATVVRNGDVLAWPEVAVAGVGWIPLDPTGSASAAGPSPTPLAQVTARARAELPPPDRLPPDPPLPTTEPTGQPGPGFDAVRPALWVVIGLLTLLILVVLAIPATKRVRTLRRRRLTGSRGVVAAWWEARDLVRANGTRVSAGMTARDLAAVSDGSIVDNLHRLAGHLDTALWSGAGADDSTVVAAWAEVREIRATLARRALGPRIRAVFAVR